MCDNLHISVEVRWMALEPFYGLVSVLIYQFDMKRNIKVVVTGACGKIAYSLFSSISSGFIFGSQAELDLRLVDLSCKQQELAILKEQIDDCCFANIALLSIYNEKDMEKPFVDVDVAIFLGGMPRKPGMERNEVYQINAEIFQVQGRYLNQVAKKTCKSLVVANPTCTNCMVLASNAPSIPRENFTALTRLDYNRFVGQTAKLLGCRPIQIKNIVVWGNHSRKEFWDASRIEVQGLSKQFLQEKVKQLNVVSMQKQMYERGGFIQEKTKGNAYISATKAIVDHLRQWFHGADRTVSMGVVLSSQKYGIPAGLCYSMPTSCLEGGQYRILQDFVLNEQQRKRILENREELLKEKAIVANYILNDN